MDVVLRHKSAAGGSPDNVWDLDPEDGRLLVSIRVASAPVVHLALPVAHASKRRRELGEYAIWSVSASAETWRVEHGIYDAHLPPPHPLLPDVSLVLTNTPERMARKLSQLAATDVPEDDIPTQPELPKEEPSKTCELCEGSFLVLVDHGDGRYASGPCPRCHHPGLF